MDKENNKDLIKSPTAIICLSTEFGGMGLDAGKLAKKISCLSQTILIAKKNTFLATSMLNNHEIKLHEVSFLTSFSPSLIFSIRKIVKKHNIKNVIFFGASELKSLFFSLLGLDINLIIRHGTRKRPKRNWYHPLIYSSVNYHIGISKDLTNNVRKGIPFGRQTKLLTIYSSILLQNDPKPRKNIQPVHIINVGRIVKDKGHIDMINACSILHRNNIDFVLTLVGEGEPNLVKHCKELAANKPYKDKIIFTGKKSNIPDLLNDNDIFFFPSYGEGLSNAFIEGLSYGLVCLAYDNTSFGEFQDLGFHLHLAKNLDPSSLETNLYNISRNLKDEKNKSLNNIIVAKKVFNPSNEIKSYANILL